MEKICLHVAGELQMQTRGLYTALRTSSQRLSWLRAAEPVFYLSVWKNGVSQFQQQIKGTNAQIRLWSHVWQFLFLVSNTGGNVASDQILETAVWICLPVAEIVKSDILFYVVRLNIYFSFKVRFNKQKMTSNCVWFLVRLSWSKEWQSALLDFFSHRITCRFFDLQVTCQGKLE